MHIRPKTFKTVYLRESLINHARDFPGGPVVVPLQCRGCGFDPWSGNYDPTCCQAIKPAGRTTEFMHHNYDQTQTNKCKEIFKKNFF